MTPRGGATPATANLDRPAFIRDEVKPGRMLASHAMHLSDQRGGLELGSVTPMARAARVMVARGKRTQRGKREQERARRVPYHSGVLQRQLGTEGWRRRCGIVAARWRRCPRVKWQHGSARAQEDAGGGSGG
jgi:hypothetical protein